MIDHVVVMAASPSRRMEPLTRTRPKAMLPILGKPMIAHVMDSFYDAGMRRFTVVVGEQEGAVVLWLTTQWHKDVSLMFAPQGHKRGTASALFAARGMIDGPFIITSCDNLIPKTHVAELCEYYAAHPSDTVILNLLYAPQEIVEGAGVVLDPRGYVMYVSEHPIGAHQDFRTVLPVYLFTPSVLDYLDRVPVSEESGERMLATAIQMMIDDGQLVGAVEAANRIRLDTPEDLLNANLRLIASLAEPILLSEIPPSVRIVPPVYIDPGVVISNEVTIGPNVYLETGTVVGHRTTIRNSVVLGRRIGREQHIEGEVVKEDRL